MSGGLGGAADHALFGVLRSLADVVLVAAGTVRAEGYGPSSTPIAVVSCSLRLDWGARFFTAPLARPILVTVAQAPPDQLARAAEVAEVVIAGDPGRRAGDRPGRPGRARLAGVLAEGGPTLNGAGLLDELCLTLSPWLASGDAKRILDGRPLPAAGGAALLGL